jgi:GR25 family glycosyltransferase involved in LPS biosynthesis
MLGQSALAHIPVYVISLPDAVIRRHNMSERLRDAKINFQFVDAFDGRTYHLPNTYDGAQIIRDGFVSETSVGCTLSHRRVHRMVANGESDLALVLEDDAKLSSEFAQVVANAAQLDFDVLKLEGVPRWRHVTINRLGSYSAGAGILPSLGSAAYLIRRSAARRFCQLSIIDQPIDVSFGDPRLALRVLELDPYPAAQDEETASMTRLQEYDRPSRGPIGLIGRLARYAEIRWARVRAYGWRTALAMERTRFRA